MDKTGLFHITRKRTTDNPGIQLPDGRSVEAIEVKKTIRWLGVLFDRKMTFKAHVKEACCRASKVINGIKILAGCYKGAPTDSLLKAVRACVLPILTYGYQALVADSGEKARNNNDCRARQGDKEGCESSPSGIPNNAIPSPIARSRNPAHGNDTG